MIITPFPYLLFDRCDCDLSLIGVYKYYIRKVLYLRKQFVSQRRPNVINIYEPENSEGIVSYLLKKYQCRACYDE